MRDTAALGVSFALIAFALAMVCAAIRLLRGPAAEDRVLALDTLYVNSMMMVLTLGIQHGVSGSISISPC